MAELSAAIQLLLATISFPPQTTLTNNTSFDYIIVGGGTAGCVLARRLAEDQNSTVLLLEAGSYPYPTSALPGAFSTLPETSVDYNYHSTIDYYAASSQGNTSRLTSGKGIGGSSILNHLVSLRCVPEDYNNLARITKDPSWNYTNILPYFIKSENVTDIDILNHYGEYHGTEGPIGLERELHNDTVASYLAGLSEVGNPTVEDFSGDIKVGYTQPLLTIKDGLRQATYVYLYGVKNNSNLYVSTNTTVSKILFNNKTAVGVQAIYNNVTYTLLANKEVILSAGTFNTPQILQLSGVGPKNHLKEFNIDVVANLPVGDTLRTPPSTVVILKTKKYNTTTSDPEADAALADLTQLPCPVLLGSVAINKSRNVPNYINIGLLSSHDTPLISVACSSVHGYREDICTNWQNETVSRDAMYNVLMNVEAESTGTVRLNSTDIFDPPLITTGFYKNSKDLDRQIEIIKDYISVLNSTAFVEFDAAVVGTDLEECSDKEYGSYEFWKCYVLKRTVSSLLYMGSCPMGTVVDGKLKVKGLENLRVIDSSLFPAPLHGTINAAVIAVAERGADIIKENEICQ